MLERLIPTFVEGQRVRIHNRPVEHKCVYCGNTEILRGYPDVFDTVILLVGDHLDTGACCGTCQKPGNPAGWYGIQGVNGLPNAGAPYPLIEAIKEE